MPYKDPGARALLQRLTIRMPAISKRHWPDGGLLTVRFMSPRPVRLAAERLALQFQRECDFDFLPYVADSLDPDQVVILIEAPKYAIAHVRIAGGAVGIDLDVVGPRAGWVYIHPYLRCRGLIDTWWPTLQHEFPGIDFKGPFTPAVAGLAKRIRDGRRPRWEFEGPTRSPS